MKIINYKQHYTRNPHIHNYLRSKSSHPKHLRVSLVYSQSVRINRICSNHNHLLNHINKLKRDFTTRDYHQNSIIIIIIIVIAPQITKNR